MTKYDNSWTVTLTFDIDMDRNEFMQYLDSCLDFDILDSYIVEDDY